ncbi:MAG: tetratricopeptide repeat protein, partial [Burkholderiales bacterium]|nr:tetratricopeptide repeat protein [Burkholderiales bacterium]
AIIAHRTGDPRALEYAQKAYALAADDPLVNDTLGWILTRAGKPDEALLHLRNALIRQGDNAAIRYHLAAALAQLGRTKEAVKELDAALKSGQLFEGLDEAKILRMRLGE